MYALPPVVFCRLLKKSLDDPYLKILDLPQLLILRSHAHWGRWNSALSRQQCKGISNIGMLQDPASQGLLGGVALSAGDNAEVMIILQWTHK